MDILNYFKSTRGSTRTSIEEQIATCLRFQDFEAGRAYKLSAYKANACNSVGQNFVDFDLFSFPMTVKLKTAVQRIDLLFPPRKKLR